jgi:hypothetical protein
MSHKPITYYCNWYRKPLTPINKDGADLIVDHDVKRYDLVTSPG